MFTRTIVPLMQREWLQYRFGWILLALVPLGLATLLVAVGQFEFEQAVAAKPQLLPLLLSVVPAVIGALVMLWITLFSGFVSIAGLARRDHADRSNEFWLSLPVPHSAALGVPVFVHLLLLPAVAMLLGWLGGQLLGVLLVGRIAGASALADVPWGATLTVTTTMALRLLGGLPIALLWALPVVLLIALLNAWFRRWGWVVLAVGLGLLSLFDQLTFGQRWLLDILGRILRRAAQSFMGAGGVHIGVGGSEGVGALLELPALAMGDFGAAVMAMASPLFVGGLLFSIACFALLVRWRRDSSRRAD
jgi:ABC-2 type transport system permease protein